MCRYKAWKRHVLNIKRKRINNKSSNAHHQRSASLANHRLADSAQAPTTSCRVRKLRGNERAMRCANAREQKLFFAEHFFRLLYRRKTHVCLSYLLFSSTTTLKRGNKNLCTSINCSVFIELCCVIVVIRVNIILNTNIIKRWQFNYDNKISTTFSRQTRCR